MIYRRQSGKGEWDFHLLTHWKFGAVFIFKTQKRANRRLFIWWDILHVKDPLASKFIRQQCRKVTVNLEFKASVELFIQQPRSQSPIISNCINFSSQGITFRLTYFLLQWKIRSFYSQFCIIFVASLKPVQTWWAQPTHATIK